jgi:3-methylcrotonyl-CoA carboxylase alpha subunit
MFRKILIANRGEIACRVIRTARRMGIVTVAVYSEADARALHVEMADEAYPIGPPPARESYLSIERILGAARASGAEAIHPGYGFLSENAEFADACAAAGVVFIGPPASAIRAMGSKSAAKALMEKSGVPLVPGYHGADQSIALLRSEAARIGFPVLIKASAGGGGKGMRIVERAADLDEAIALAKGEARSSFGDDQVLIERYLTRPRHIEIQVFADTHGNVVSLFERDCSIQRRHQKIIEEAPAPGMDVARRRSMGEAACAAARAIGYVGAGTVEFIAEGDAFYFMEMNTRLQVEHPVTEAITRQDLVEWQLRVASGERLPLSQDALSIAGHAIEVRVYAEDPARDFAPSVGTLLHVQPPREDAQVRVDTGVRSGDVISVNYDPMIAKLIVWGPDREAAARRLSRALAEYEIVGVRTNVGLLRTLVDHPAFRAGQLDTGFIPRHAADLFRVQASTPPVVLAAAVCFLLLDEQRGNTAANGDRHSPWNLPTAWRMNGDGYQDFVLRDGETENMIRAHFGPGDAIRLDLPGGTAELASHVNEDDALTIMLDGVKRRARVVRDADTISVVIDGASHVLAYVDPRAPGDVEDAGSNRVIAPMPGTILEVAAEPGASVERGAVLVVMEAMKVQMRITAPADGVIAQVRCRPGELVDEGTELVTFEDRT